MMYIIAIWSIRKPSSRKPVHWSWSSESTNFFTRLSSTLSKSFCSADRLFMPLQSSQLLRSSFGLLMKYFIFQFVSTSPHSQIVVMITWNIFVVIPISNFRVSACTLSGSVALPFHICLMSLPISSTVGGLSFLKKTVCGGSMLVGFIESNLSKGSYEFCTHQV